MTNPAIIRPRSIPIACFVEFGLLSAVRLSKIDQTLPATSVSLAAPDGVTGDVVWPEGSRARYMHIPSIFHQPAFDLPRLSF